MVPHSAYDNSINPDGSLVAKMTGQLTMFSNILDVEVRQ